MQKPILFIYSLLAAFWLLGCQQKAQKEALSKESSLPVKIEKVSQEVQTDDLLYSGDIRPLRESNANFTIPGKITLLPYEEGDFVNQGQLIGSLDPADYQIELKRAEAQLLAAKDAYERFRQLYEKKSLPERDYISAESAYRQAQAAKEMIAKKIADTRLLAPTGGIVMEKNAEVGSSVGNDVAVYRIASLNPAYAEISVPEAEIGKIQKGQVASVKVPTLSDQTFEGIIKIIAPVANPQTRTFSVKILIENPDYLLKGGMIAEVRLHNTSSRGSKIIQVPSQAVLKSPDDKSYLFVADLEKKQAERRKVSVGKVQGNAVEVLEGLQKDEWVIVAGQHKLHDGQKIQINDSKLISSNR